MDKQIKINAWNKENNIMHYFINNPDNFSFSFLDINFFEWLRYIGFRDKNGREIYENDIILSTNRIYDPESSVNIVELFNGCWRLRRLDKNDIPLFNYKQDELEYLGNTFKNPELINP